MIIYILTDHGNLMVKTKDGNMFVQTTLARFGLQPADAQSLKGS